MLNEINKETKTIVFGEDSIVIQKYIAGIPGGVTLDLSGYTENVVKAGHVIIETSDGKFQPLGTSENAYTALPKDAKYAGILYRSVDKKNPAASIMKMGVVNEELLPYALPTGFTMPGTVVVVDTKA